MALSPFHGLLDITLSGIHVPYQWSYATGAARIAAGGFAATDVGKVALQTSDNTLWVLTATTPAWAALGTSPALDGWTIYDQVTWVYSSADSQTGVFTVAGVDLTSVIPVGTKIKLTQTATVKYFIVTAVLFGGGNTTVTIYGGTDYTLANAAISATYYSRKNTPVGFPRTPAKWTVTMTRAVTDVQNTPTSGTWYNLGTQSITIPIGLWFVTWMASSQNNTVGSSAQSEQGTLSTANNSESDTEFTSFCRHDNGAASQTIGFPMCRTKLLALAAKTQYFLNAKTADASANNIEFRGDLSLTKVEAICAYL